MKKEAENIFSLPVALIFQNTSSIDNLIDSMNIKNTTGSILLDHISNEKSFTSNSFDKFGDIIRRELKWGFILHAYGFGCLFFILAFYTFFSVLNLRSFISSRPFMSTINGFLCLLGTSRAGSLLIDPYNLKETMPKILGQIIWDLGFPSIISAFCLVQLAFLQLTQLKIGPEGLRKKNCLSLIVAAHFMLTIGMDIIVASHENLLIVKYVIQYIFLTWGVILCCSFLYSGYKVMSMIRNIPGGFKHRDLPDPNHKGIMQLAMLAPHNNLAGSVTAALLPTLCAPKIHQQDNTSMSTMGFRNEGNSRILESESIPMLEEMAGSSGDERNSKPLTRGSSFQNQIRNTHKFNLKPKLSLKSCSDFEQKEEKEEKSGSPKMVKSLTPRSPPSRMSSPRPRRFEFVSKNNNGILKGSETFVTTKDIHEFRSKIQNRGNFEGDHSWSSNDKKLRNESDAKKLVNREETFETLIPGILISSASRSNSSEIMSEKHMSDSAESKKENDFINEESLKMVADGEEKDEIKQASKGKKDKDYLNPEGSGKLSKRRNDGERKGSTSKRPDDSSRRGSQAIETGIRRNSYRRDCNKESNTIMEEMYPVRCSRESSALSDTNEFNDSFKTSPDMRDRKKNKSLSWKKRVNEHRIGSTHECLMPQDDTTTDVSLSAILNHIAYVNRAALTADTASQEELEKVRKSKVEWVLNVTYITAMWGLMLCLSNMGRIYNPYGVPESRQGSSLLRNSTISVQASPEAKGDGIFSSPWPWLWFQTFCRALELAMGCAMANITRQPTATYRNPHTLSIRHRDTLYNI